MAQELAALGRMTGAELAAYFPEKWKRVLEPGAAHAVAAETPQKDDAAERDPRLPSPGTVISRVHDGVEHRVTVLDDGFEYQGRRYRSLSAIARAITGTPWNGYTFFLGRSKGSRR